VNSNSSQSAGTDTVHQEAARTENPPIGQGASSLHRRAWLVVALLWLVGCLNYLDRVMITTMRSSLMEDIAMTEKQFGMLTTAFLIVYGLLSPFAGYLADRFSRSLVIIASLFIWSFITWLTAHAKTYEQLLATRFLMGISEACYIPASLALVTDYHRGNTRSRATGLLLVGVFVGSGMGGLGGWLAERHGWGYSFSLFGIIGMVYCIVLAVLLRDPPKAAQSETGNMPQQKVRLKEALVSLFSNGIFILLLAYWGLLALAGWMVVGWMPTYFQEHFHMKQGAAGLSATVYLNIACMIGLVTGGTWADRWGARNRYACITVPIIGLCLAAPSIFLVAHAGIFPLAVVGLIAYGLTRTFADAEMMPILCLTADARYRATGFGVLNFFSCLVGGATIYLGGYLRDIHVNINKLFQVGAFGILVCAAILWWVRVRSRNVP
jgi:MFS family permease